MDTYKIELSVIGSDPVLHTQTYVEWVVEQMIKTFDAVDGQVYRGNCLGEWVTTLHGPYDDLRRIVLTCYADGDELVTEFLMRDAELVT